MDEKILFTLDKTEVNQTVRVKKLCVCGDIRRRLLDIGLVEGTAVQCVLRPFRGGPAAYMIRGAVIALRSEDAGEIYVG